MEAVINIFLTILAIYFALGLLFALYFIFAGASKVDPLLKESRWVVRLLLTPGCIAVWPLLLINLFRAKRHKNE